MRSIRFAAALAAMLIAALLLGGCKDSTPSGPVAGMGNTTVTKYVAIGNSLTAGYQSGGLFQSGQIYSYPNLIAGQLNLAGASVGSFEMPLYSDPGTPDPKTGKASRYEILSMTGPVIGPAGAPPGAPINLTLARPYDNLGIPGAVIYDFLDTTSFLAKAGPPRNNPLFSLVLRNSVMGKNILQQASALHPDLVTFWLGNNDVLGYATSGGVSPSAPTSSAAFGALYAQALGALRAALPNAKIVVANIPNVTCVPYFTTVGPRVAASLPAGYYLRYQKHGNTSLAFDSTRFTEATPPFITLPGQTYALLIGHPSGKWYRDNGVALPAGIDTTKPFGLHPQNPWPDALMLDADEQAVAAGAVSAFNGIIASQASVNGAAVVDINLFFTGIKANGLLVSGQEFTADYVSGGLFSLDGVHPSSRGQAVVANEFLRVINGKFGTSIPMVDVGTVPGIPSPLAKGAAGLQVDPSLYQTMQDLFGSSR